MGLVRVIKGTGKGSWFRYGRFLGIHNPFDKSLGKAKDPFINTRRLIRLSWRFDPRVRNAATENLIARMRKGEVSVGTVFSLLAHIQSSIVIEAFCYLARIAEDPAVAPKKRAGIRKSLFNQANRTFLMVALGSKAVSGESLLRGLKALYSGLEPRPAVAEVMKLKTTISQILNAHGVTGEEARSILTEIGFVDP